MTPSPLFPPEISLFRFLRSSRLPARGRRDLRPPRLPLLARLSAQCSAACGEWAACYSTACRRMPQARSRVPGDHERPHPTGQGSAEPRLGNRTATAIAAIGRCAPETPREGGGFYAESCLCLNRRRTEALDNPVVSRTMDIRAWCIHTVCTATAHPGRPRYSPDRVPRGTHLCCLAEQATPNPHPSRGKMSRKGGRRAGGSA